MEKPQLTDLFPQPGTFKLKSTGTEHTLRPINLMDQAWIARAFGGSHKLQEALEAGDLEAICKLAFHQLEDRSKFTPEPGEEYEDLDADLNPVKIRVTGAHKLMMAVGGASEQLGLMKAIMRTIGISQPLEEALEENVGHGENPELEAAAKAAKKKAKKKPRRRTGSK